MIKTNNLDDFLHQEYVDHYNKLFHSEDYFKEVMKDMPKRCKNCGCYYWSGSMKRCACI